MTHRAHRSPAPSTEPRPTTRARSAAAAALAVGIAGTAVACSGPLDLAPPPPSGTPTTWSLPDREVDVAADGILGADAWPDACELGTATETELSGPEPTGGELPDGTSLPGARECRWTTADGGEVSLRVVVVTLDVLEAWAGYRYTAGLRRDVEEIAAEAFLVPGAPGEAETLWICQGLTIGYLETSGLGEDEAREVMFDVTRSAVEVLDGTPAGARGQPRPDPSA
ncbi:MAG: hypothetical protein ACFCVF_10225 [Kineosporiaceae bacterium]